MSTILNQHHQSTLPCNTIWNSKNDSHCLGSTTQKRKTTIHPPMLVVDNMTNDPANINNDDQDDTEITVMNYEVFQKPIVIEKRVM